MKTRMMGLAKVIKIIMKLIKKLKISKKFEKLKIQLHRE